jgi:hypothetical protein
MKSEDLLVRCLVWRDGVQWVALCVDFDLAAQGDTMAAAQSSLEEQISDYVREAVTVDRAHGGALLRRKAPLRHRLMFRWLELLAHIDHLRTSRTAYESPLPMMPLAA